MNQHHNAPRIPEVGVVFVVPDHWRSLPMSRHRVAMHLARYFRVAWIDAVPTGTGRRIDEQREDTLSGEFAEAGLVVHTASSTHRLAQRSQRARNWLLRQRVRRALRKLRFAGARYVVLYVWRPHFAPAIERLDHDAVVYHVDDEYSFSESEQPISDDELYLLRHADRVFVHSPGLIERKGRHSPHAMFLPNGVDYAAFATPAEMPADLAAVPAPRIGYAGVIKSQLNVDLLVAIAQQRPDWSFVLVGPVGNMGTKQPALDVLQQLPNVHLLGCKTLPELPAYMQHFDVATMCYAVNDYTNCIYPLKLHEYLATGTPVVSSAIRTARDFADYIELADTAADWVAAIERCLGTAATAPAAAQRRRALASRHDWERIVAAIADEIGQLAGCPVQRGDLSPHSAADADFSPGRLANFP